MKYTNVLQNNLIQYSPYSKARGEVEVATCKVGKYVLIFQLLRLNCHWILTSSTVTRLKEKPKRHQSHNIEPQM